MLSKTLLSTALLASTTLAANSVAVYWGQNGAGGQDRLSTYCQETDLDIVLLSFLNDFPDPLNVNFANQCGDTFDGGLLHCSRIGEDIKTCQSLGKKVLLSLGGGIGNYGFSNTDDATSFATTLWNKFGNGQDDERPFDDAVVDGFDFDIEVGSTTGYPELATALRSKFDGSKQYYLSAAPQCPYPDAHLGALISSVPLDFLFIQFYNNQCSIDGQFNFETWQQFAQSAPNTDVKLYVGVPAQSSIPGYVNSEELSQAIEQIKCDKNFAGVSIWDASGAWQNVVDGKNYVEQVKQVLNDNVCESSFSSSSSSSTSTTSSSTQGPVSTPVTNDASSTAVITTSASAAPSSAPYSNSTASISSIASGSSVSSNSGSTTTTGSTPITAGSGSNSGSGVKTITDIQKTVITVTSCSENKCSAHPTTVGFVTYTDLHTVYTTYCPATATAVVVPNPTGSPSKVSSAPGTAAAESSSSKGVSQLSSAPGVIAVGSSASATTKGPIVITTSQASVAPGETTTEYVAVTSTIYPSIAGPSYNSSSNVTTPQVPTITYEGGAMSNTAVWFTPLLFGAIALF